MNTNFNLKNLFHNKVTEDVWTKNGLKTWSLDPWILKKQRKGHLCLTNNNTSKLIRWITQTLVPRVSHLEPMQHNLTFTLSAPITSHTPQETQIYTWQKYGSHNRNILLIQHMMTVYTQSWEKIFPQMTNQTHRLSPDVKKTSIKCVLHTGCLFKTALWRIKQEYMV